MRCKQLGYALIELVVFIIVVGIAVAAVIAPLTTVLLQSPVTFQQITTAALASQRMEIILGQRLAYGISGTTDPCQSGSPPAVCTLPAALSGYSVKSSIANISIGPHSGFKYVNVTATAPSNAASLNLQNVFGGP